MLETNRELKLREYVVNRLRKDESQDPAHRDDHALRVKDIGIQIGLKEGANIQILEPSLLLHDIIRPNDPELEKIHSELSTNYARDILPDFDYTPEEIESICRNVLTHSRSSLYGDEKTLEAKIIYDADKIDGLGYDGIDRTCKLCGVRGYTPEQTVKWYLGRILDVVKNEPLYTKSGKKIANDRLEISLLFCKQLLGKDYDKILLLLYRSQ